MLHDRVTSNDIARVVAKATGIPVQNLLKGERDKLVHVRAIVGLCRWLIHGTCRWKKRSDDALSVRTMPLQLSVTL